MAERSDYYDPASPKLARRTRVSLTMSLPLGLFGVSSLYGTDGTLIVGQVVMFGTSTILIGTGVVSYFQLRRHEIAAKAKAAKPQPTPRIRPRPQVATVAAPAPAPSTTSPADDRWAWADDVIAVVSEPTPAPAVALAPVQLPTFAPAPAVPAPAPTPAAVDVADKPVPAKPATNRSGGRFWNKESGTAVKAGELEPVGAATGK